MRRFDYRRDYLVGLQAIVVVAFITVSVSTSRLLDPLETAADDIAFNAVPSVVELTAARAEARVALSHLARFAALETPRAAAEPATIERALRGLDERLERYFALPPFPGEVEHWDALRQARASLATSVRATLHAGLAAPDTRLSFSATELLGARFFEVTRQLVQLNVDRAKERATRIGEVRTRATNIGYVLDGLVLSLVVVTAIVANRQHRIRVALEAARAAQSEERANELELFAARVAHDIRSPLQATTLTLASMRRHASSPEQLTKQIERSERGVRRVLTLTDDLLAFARSGARASQEGRSSLTSVLTEVVAELTPTAEAAKISLQLEPLPELTVQCASGVLTSTFSNLVRNAISHLGDATERTVVVRGERVGPTRVRVDVEDSGPGVPADLRAEIFELYVRGRTSAPGFGLGLATAKRLVESHGGAIGLAPRPGGGSIFWFELPTSPEGSE
jgi:signal transduction histidine kinase